MGILGTAIQEGSDDLRRRRRQPAADRSCVGGVVRRCAGREARGQTNTERRHLSQSRWLDDANPGCPAGGNSGSRGNSVRQTARYRRCGFCNPAGSIHRPTGSGPDCRHIFHDRSRLLRVADRWCATISERAGATIGARAARCRGWLVQCRCLCGPQSRQVTGEPGQYEWTASHAVDSGIHLACRSADGDDPSAGRACSGHAGAGRPAVAV